MFFDAILNGIFLLSFTDSLLLVYRHATDFWVLIYPEMSLNSCIGSNSFLMEPLGFAMQAILLLSYLNPFIFLLPNFSSEAF